MSMDRHEPFEELISASLSGDLTAAERARLDTHLDTCAECRSTLAAFADQRRIMSGLRHVVPPRDLGARVRTGIERGRFAPLPWWRRPVVLVSGIGGSLAAVGGVILALAVINAPPSNRPVGDTTPTPTPPAATVSASASAPSIPSLPPSATPAESPVEPTPLPTPPGSIGYGAVNYLQWEGTLADQRLTLRGWDPATEASAHLLDLDEGEVEGEPVVAAFSPDSQWLAYQVAIGQKGTNEVVVTHLPSGTDFSVGETPDASVFSTRMAWSPDSRYLAFTAAGVTGPDARTFDTGSQATTQLSDSGATYVASFARSGELWLSQAGRTPVSYAVSADRLDDGVPVTPAEGRAVEGVFQPLLSPSGEHAIFWRGSLRPAGAGWEIERNGMLYLSGEPIDGQPSWSGEPLFPTLTAEDDALVSARVAWAYDSDGFAVWAVDWRGPVRDELGGAFPDPTAVYLGRARERDLVDGAADALRFVDPSSNDRPVDVSFVALEPRAETPWIAVTIFEEPSGEAGESPVGESRLILSPMGGSDADLPEIGRDAAWAGLALYVPQGDEGR